MRILLTTVSPHRNGQPCTGDVMPDSPTKVLRVENHNDLPVWVATHS